MESISRLRRAAISAAVLMISVPTIAACGGNTDETDTNPAPESTLAKATASESTSATAGSVIVLPANHTCEFAADEFVGPFQLTDGELRTDQGASIDVTQTLEADVNSDGAEDRIVQLMCSGGASGGTNMVVYVPAGGQDAIEINYASDSESYLAQGRADLIGTITVSGDSLTIDAYVSRWGDPTCCPTGKVDIRYELGASGPVFESADRDYALASPSNG